MNNRFNVETLLKKIDELEKEYQEINSKRFDITCKCDEIFERLNELKWEYFSNYINLQDKYIKYTGFNTYAVLKVDRIDNFSRRSKSYCINLSGTGFISHNDGQTYNISSYIELTIEDDRLHVINNNLKELVEITPEQYKEEVNNFIQNKFYGSINI